MNAKGIMWGALALLLLAATVLVLSWVDVEREDDELQLTVPIPEVPEFTLGGSCWRVASVEGEVYRCGGPTDYVAMSCEFWVVNRSSGFFCKVGGGTR